MVSKIPFLHSFQDFADHKKRSKPGLLSRVGGTVKSAASVGSSLRSKERDPEFAKLSEHIASYREQMAVTDRVAERLLLEEKGETFRGFDRVCTLILVFTIIRIDLIVFF